MIAQVYSDDNIEVYRFLSTDEKPLSCKHGSRALEIDTGLKYIFDAENSIWQEVHDSDEGRQVDAYTKEETQALLLTKVDKVSGMGLSQESYTTAEKQKLAGIEAGATAVTVDSDLSSTSTNPVQNQAIYEDKQRQDNEINYAINTGSKNILNITALSRVHRGVTFTTNRDGSVTISGATTGTNSFFRLTGNQSSSAYADQVPIPRGRYKISCSNPPAAEEDRFVFTVGYRQTSDGSRTTKEANYANGYENEFEITTDTGRFDATILSVSTTQSYSITAYPMIRLASITDPTFEPYAMPNAQLTSEIGVYGLGKAIYASSTDAFDFNDLKTPGVYVIGLTALGYSVNAPRTDAAARIEVKYLDSENNIRQEFYPLVGSNPYYVRQCRTASTGWGPWYLFEGTVVT